MPPTRRRRPPRPGALSELPPLRIIRSILLLQLSYYAAAFVFILFTALVLGQPFSLNLVFDWAAVRGDNTFGWTLGVVWVAVGFVTVIPLLLLINRSRLIPDFALTIHFLHLLTTTLYSRSLPTNLLWWALQAGSAFLMVSLGVWACRYREMQPITFGLGGKTPAEAAAAKNAQSNGHVQDGGTVRGGPGGRTTDAGPSYEMVNMRGDENV